MPALARNLLLAAAAFTIAVATTEGVLALRDFSFSFAPEHVEFGYPNPRILEQRYARDPDLFWVTKDYAAGLVALSAQPLDIVFLGDSTTELGRYPGQFLQRANALARAGAPGIHGRKLGVSGWSSYQGLQALERDVAPAAPRFVTFYFGWNDHWIGFGIEDADIHAVTRSPLARLQGLRVGQLAMKAHYASRSGAGLVEQRVSPDDFAANLRAMVALARAHEIVPVLLTAPTSHRRGHEPAYLAQRWLRDLSQLVPLHQRYVEIVRRIAAEQGAPLCDLERDFAALPLAQLRDELFMSDGIHLQAAGDAQLAAFLVECFRTRDALRALWGDS